MTIDELDETFTVTLSNPVNAMIASSTQRLQLLMMRVFQHFLYADVSTSDEDPNYNSHSHLSGEHRRQ